MYSQQFVNLVMGDRGIYPTPFEKGPEANPAIITGMGKTLVANNYWIKNMADVMHLNLDELSDLMDNFQPDMKEGYILRKGFADSQEFQAYTDEDWKVIFAQYSLTYGWPDKFAHMYNEDPAQVINDHNDEAVGATKIMERSKEITIGFRSDVVKLMREILESKTVLREHQVQTLEACPVDVLTDAFQGANVTMREILIKTIKLLRNTNVTGFFKNPTDVLRYIVAVHAEEPFEGQILAKDLTHRHIHIPTSSRKFLLNELNNMGDPKSMCEDMFKFETYWKIIDRYLRFTKIATSRKRFPKYHMAMDLLYDGDRSWTFNGRYSAAIEAGDFKKALEVAQERPGFLLRNMMQFLRYPKGTAIAVERKARNVSLSPAAKKALTKVAVSDDLSYFESADFQRMISYQNPKLAFQLYAELSDPSLTKDQSTRLVQGVTKSYSTPIPGIQLERLRTVKSSIMDGVALNLRNRNSAVGKVYLDPALDSQALQWSGRNQTGINQSGTYVGTGSRIPLPDTDILRLGVMWRGPSTDIDHNVTLYDGDKRVKDVYFGSPEYKSWVTSSGDITSCSATEFSVELIDIDLAKAKSQSEVTNLVSSLYSYSGYPKTIGKLECYLFVAGIEKKHRIVSRRQLKIDLMDTDYAMRLDPNNSDNATDYLGLNVDLTNETIQVVGLSTGEKGNLGSTVRGRKISPSDLAQIMPNSITLLQALQTAFDPDQLVDDPEEADVVFGDGGLNPWTQQEEIYKFLF